MTDDRARRLHATANQQVDELIALTSGLEQSALRLPCPGRAKLGDGTVAATIAHTVGNYRRIAEFVTTGGHGGHGDHAAGDLRPDEIVTQLAATRNAFTRIGELSDAQLDAVPAKDSFRFCDGQRTVDQVLTSLLKHQDHQLDALRRAIRRPEMTASEVVNAYLAAYTSGDTERAAALVSDDFRFRGPTTEIVGRDAFAGMVRHIAPHARGYRMLRQWADGDEVCSVYEFGVEPSTGATEVLVSECNSVRDGRVCSSLMVFDTAPFQAPPASQPGAS